MTVIRVWRGYTANLYNPFEDTQFTGNVPVLAGHTLVRTILTVELQETANFPHFPPLPPLPVAVGYYQAVNTGSLVGLPAQTNLDVDWVCYGVPQFFADFGVTSTLQSDLVWQASLTMDVKSERKALIANPSFTVSIGKMGAPFGGLSRARQLTGSVTFRHLWQHNI